MTPKMLLKNRTSESLVADVTLLLAALSGGFLFAAGSHAPQYLLLFFSVLTIFLRVKNKNCNECSCFERTKDFLVPWLPWYCTTAMLVVFFYGVPKCEDILFSLLLLMSLFVALHDRNIRRRKVVVLLSGALLLMCLSIIFQILTTGVHGSTVIGVNKNKVLGIASVVSVCCMGSLLFDTKLHDTKSKILLVSAVFCTGVAIVLAEVRTAILPFVIVIPVLLCFRRKNKKAVLTFLITAFFLLCLSFLTGRMQEGLIDLQKYSTGNPNSSWGIRLEFWKFVIRCFFDSPIFGWGEKPFDAMINSGHTIRLEVSKFYHFHNDFLNWLAIGGVIGVGGWFYTIFLLFKQTKKDPVRLIFLIGCLSVGLTEQFWFQRTALFTCVTIWTLLYISSRESDEGPRGRGANVGG